jgi:hypothetical protein
MDISEIVCRYEKFLISKYKDVCDKILLDGSIIIFGPNLPLLILTIGIQRVEDDLVPCVLDLAYPRRLLLAT